MENLRLIPAVILITVMTGSSALAGAPAESGERSDISWQGTGNDRKAPDPDRRRHG